MKDLQSQEKKYLILQEISSFIAATKDINTLAYLSLDRAIGYTDAEKGSVMLLNDMNELYILAARGFDVPFIETYRVKLGEGIAGMVALNRSNVLVEDIEKDKRFKRIRRDRYKTKSFISCSIISRDKLFGVININDKKNGTPFTEDELNLVNAIADQAAIAFENAFLINQLRSKAAELEELNRKLIETDLNKTEFITRISHELRSPLNSIKGAIYFLKQSERLNKNKLTEFYEIISRETTGLVSIVEDLLEFLRLENEALVIKKSLINLTDILHEAIQSKGLSIILTKKNIHLHMEKQNKACEIIGDKIKVVQLFINLIDGLTYYLKNGDSIKIAVHENDFVEVRMVVSRNLPSDEFSFFYKSKYLFYTESSDAKLRLYHAKSAAEAHGWKFQADNSKNEFVISLYIPKSAKDKLETTVNMTMDIFAEVISELLDLNICSIMIRDKLTADLTIQGAKGLSDEIIKKTRVHVGDQIAGWVASEGKPLLIEDIEKDLHFPRISIAQYNTRSLLSVPMKINDNIIGVVNLNNKKTAEPFNTRDLYIASALSERVAHFLEKCYADEYKEADVNRILTSFSNLLDAMKKNRKKATLLPELVLRIMDKLGTEEEDKKKALYISKVYDLGLECIDESILMKKDLLPSEKQFIRMHPYTSVGLLSNFEFSEDIKKAILHHHERYDGTGYPDKLQGAEIPLISRVLSVADSYVAMIFEKPYGKTNTHEEAVAEIQAGSGSRYDPEIVKAFREVSQEMKVTAVQTY
jgi:GAF domain-containing protein